MSSAKSQAKLDPLGTGRAGSPSSAQLALDNLIRRELRIGDPNDPSQVAKGLMDRYQSDNRARAIRQEAEGLPFLLSAPTAMVAPPAERTATSIDLEQAENDVRKDLDELTGNNLLKDVTPELEGWADAIRSAIGEGTAAARLGLDPRNRDRAFGVRRVLGDYARLARLVGALTPSVNHSYRSLAQSLDEVSAVILVMVGESMANAGFAGGRYLLQAPYGELQTRRDAVMHALRNLQGALNYTQGQNEWPRGIDAYRKLFDALEAQGQGDLRALMTEQELGRIMDGLVRRAAQGNPDGLRALGSTAQVDLQRVYRLINFGYRLVDPESPPLTSFLESLRLFADGFGASGGFRLLRVSRPPIVFYGLYAADEEEPADRRLTQLTIWRGRLASQLDCLLRCDCSPAAVQCQVLLDKVLYDIDRAIDLYALGQHDLGLPEIRAAAYSYIIDDALREEQEPGSFTYAAALRTTLRALSGWLRPKHDQFDPATGAFVASFAAQRADWGLDPDAFELLRTRNETITGSTFHFTDLMHQELCLQREAELRWELLVRQMAPNCIPPGELVGADGGLVVMIENAMEALALGAHDVQTDCGMAGPDIPADLETSLDALAFDRGRDGSTNGTP
jgi:hypothetical protein